MQTLALFDVLNDGKASIIIFPEKDTVDISILPPAFRQGYIALVAGARHYTSSFR